MFKVMLKAAVSVSVFHNFVASKKYREALRHGRVAFVVDDVLPPSLSLTVIAF